MSLDGKKAVRYSPVIALVMYLIFKLVPLLSNLPDGTDTDPAYVPTSAQQQELGPVIEVLAKHPEAKPELGKLFFGLETVIGSDRKILTNTQDVRNTHQQAGALAVQAGQIPFIPGYNVAVDKYITLQIGDEVVPLNDANRAQVVDVFKSLGWATRQ
tara:strand:- start:445 stop:915 length:471 start_codon:yes stop_codon:yes gene_type:complete